MLIKKGKEFEKALCEKTWDDLVLDEEKDEIKKLEKKLKQEDLCPHLRKKGEFFYYCAFYFNETECEKPFIENPLYNRKVDMIELKVHCAGKYTNCFFIKRKQTN